MNPLNTELRPHQQRAIEKLRASGGLLAAHGLGSGKTLTSIAAAQALGLPIDAVVPASLVANYEKELEKHLGEVPVDTRIRSYQRATRDPGFRPGALAVLDEAHRLRNPGTAVEKEVGRRAAEAAARLLLTATPVYNQPEDLAMLLNVAAGKDVLPRDRAKFRSTFVGQREIKPGLWGRIRGAESVYVPTLINRQKLIDAAKGYVDVHRGGGEDFPSRVDEEYDVELSPKQREIYKWHEGKIPWHVSYKIRHNLPLSKAESKDLNAFQGALRQVSNTPRPYVSGMTDDEELKHAPKLRQVASHLIEMQKANPSHKGLIYSNYLEGGLLPLSRHLEQQKVPHAIFHGGLSKAEKARLVQEFNEGKTPTLLVSSSGTEGLDLKGTGSVQVVEPHWNDSKIDQVIGRAIRYRSHAHLPKDQQRVRVMRYYSSLPKPLFGKSDAGIERYMQNMSKQKSEIGSQIMSALQEASDAGPLKPAVAKVAEALDLRDLGRALAGRLPQGLATGVTGALGAGGYTALRRRTETGEPDWRAARRSALRAGSAAAVLGTLLPAAADLYSVHRAEPLDPSVRTISQALDNLSKDTHLREGTPVPGEANWAWLSKHIGPSSGEKVIGPDLSEYTINRGRAPISARVRPRFAVHLDSVERDVAGRKAGVLVAGYVPRQRNEADVDALLSAIEQRHATAEGGRVTFKPEALAALRKYLMNQRR